MSDDGKVVSIFDRKVVDAPVTEFDLREVRAAAIKQLEQIVTEFRNGELNGFAIVCTRDGGGTMHDFSEEVHAIPIEYLGAISRLQHHINLTMDYSDEADPE